MGRIKLEEKIKRKAISIALDEEVFTGLDNLKVKSKSQLINWLLKEHFNMLKPLLK